MSFTFIAGPAASGKTRRMVELIASEREKGTKHIFYLVPEQSGLEAQRYLLDNLPGHCLLGVEALSFQRFSYRILSETGLSDVESLSDTGKCMVLIKITRDHQKELLYYGRSIHLRGFIGSLKLMITEIIQYGLTEQDLLDLSEAQPGGSLLRLKLHDMALIWHYYQEYTQGHVLSSESLLDLATARIPSWDTLKDAVIFIDDFNGFTPQQYHFLGALVRKAAHVYVSLTITPQAFEQAEKTSAWRSLPRTLFFTPQKTTVKLIDLCRENGLSYRTMWVNDDRRPQELKNVGLSVCLLNSGRAAEKAEHAFGYMAADPAGEMRFVLHEILYLCREKGIAFRDITILVCGLSAYRQDLDRLFQLYGIPAFFDQKVLASSTPYLQLLRTLGELETSAYAQEPLLRLLHSGLLNLPRDQVDALENRILAENPVGFEAVHQLLSQSESDEIRAFSVDLLLFHEALLHAKTVSQITAAYRAFTKARQIEDTLEAQADAAYEAGRLSDAYQKRRLYAQAQTVQDQLLSVLSDTEVSLQEYVQIFNLGLEQLKLGQIPESQDEISVGDLTTSRPRSSKVLFLMGIRGGSFPNVSANPGLLTDQEREECGIRIELAQGEKEKLSEQFYLLYTALGKARELVFFTGCENDAAGDNAGTSLLWNRLCAVLGPSFLLQDKHTVTLPQPMLYEAAGETGQKMPLYTRQNLTRFLREQGKAREASLLEEGAKVTAGQEKLSAPAALSLMDPTSRTLSVTQLEKYASCPFAYYLTYGLTLKQRELPEVRPLEDGQVLHELLEEAGRAFAAGLTREQAQELSRDLIDKREGQYSVYQTTGRYRFYWNRLQQAAGRALNVLSSQVSGSSFKPVVFEWTFGYDQKKDKEGPDGAAQPSGEAICLTLSDGSKIRLGGKIDRVDLLDLRGQKYIEIIDYKSGSTTYDPSQLYAGEQLQLPVYLDAAESAFEAEPAGFFYFHVQPDLTKLKENEPWPDATESAHTTFDLERARLDGVMLKDTDLAYEMDHSLREGSKGMILNVRLNLPKSKKNPVREFDSHYKNLASRDDFRCVTGFARKKSAQLAERMKRGWIEKSPSAASNGGKSACTYCIYAQACPFDKRLPAFRERRIEHLTQPELLDRIRKEEES